MESAMLPYVERFWQSGDGLRLFARDYAPASGDARCPVICIHGLTRNSSDFEDVAPSIAAAGRRVLAVDIRGRGRSAYDSEASHYNPMVYAKDLIKLCSDLGISRAVFIGTSMGGIIMMTLALRRLSLISAAILNDVGPVISQRGLTRIAGYIGKGRPVTSWESAAEYVKNINGSAFPDYTWVDWEKFARRTFAENAHGQLVLKFDPNIARPLLEKKVKASSMIAKFAFRRLARKRPTLLIRGGLSDIIELEQANYMRSVAPTMEYAEVSRVGHAPMLTETEARDAIGRFLAKIP